MKTLMTSPPVKPIRGDSFTKSEAIDLMTKGYKITHRFFASNEWITIQNGKVLTSDGVSLSLNSFFSTRFSRFWENGYKLFE